LLAYALRAAYSCAARNVVVLFLFFFCQLRGARGWLAQRASAWLLSCFLLLAALHAGVICAARRVVLLRAFWFLVPAQRAG
ncbi:hypothetical protein A2U01_0062495, partial [Trifolium medium]|nr:hypothetical protein [Trifolium medium]